MSKRQQIIQLLKQKVNIHKICEQLKVSKHYVYSVKSQLAKKVNDKSKRIKVKNKKDIHYLTLTCKKCKRVYEIRVNNPELYTEEVKRNWVCLNCK